MYFPIAWRVFCCSYYCLLHACHVLDGRHTFSVPHSSESINRTWCYISCVNSVIERAFDSVLVTWNNVPLNSCSSSGAERLWSLSITTGTVQCSAVAIKMSGVGLAVVTDETECARRKTQVSHESSAKPRLCVCFQLLRESCMFSGSVQWIHFVCMFDDCHRTLWSCRCCDWTYLRFESWCGYNFFDCYVSWSSLFTSWIYRDYVIDNTYLSHESRFRIDIINVKQTFPVQAQRVLGGLRLPNFKTIGTWRL
jgi:hypothetical protein